MITPYPPPPPAPSHTSPPDSNPVKRLKTASVESPRQFFLTLLLSCRGSLWDHTPEGRTQLTQWSRCVEYFDLLCNLIHETKCEFSTIVFTQLRTLYHHPPAPYL